MKKGIIGFVLGALIFGSIGVVSAYTILANDIGYTPKDTTWEVDNVKDAIDELYDKANTSKIIWVNENPGSNFEPMTLNIDLSPYQSIIVLGYYAPSYSGITGYVKINKNSSGTLRAYYNQNDCATRNIVVDNNSIQIMEGHRWNNSIGNEMALPLYIIGVK